MAEFSVTALRVVGEVVERGSFSRAARHLGYTQSAVSRQVAIAEVAAGRPLFERGARGVVPTDAGREVARAAGTIAAELDRLRAGLADLRPGLSGRVRVGGVSTAMAGLVPTAVTVLARDEPGLRVSVREGSTATLLRAVRERRADCAVVAGHVADDSEVLLSEVLLEDPLLLAVPRQHRLARARAVAPDDLVDDVWITGSTDPGTALGGGWMPPGGTALLARDWIAKFGLVAAGRGVTVVPGIAAGVVPATLSLIRIDHPGATRTTRLVARDEPPAARAADALRAAAVRLAADTRSRLVDRT